MSCGAAAVRSVYATEDMAVKRFKVAVVMSLMMLLFLLPFSSACFVRNCPTGGKRSQSALRQVLFCCCEACLLPDAFRRTQSHIDRVAFHKRPSFEPH